jgi:hypothetical protein
MKETRDIMLVYNHAIKRASERFKLILTSKALKELSAIAINSSNLGYQTYNNIPRRSLREVHLYLSDETRKLNNDIKKEDTILAVCGKTVCAGKNNGQFRILTFLPETEIDGKIYKSTYHSDCMRW